MHVLVLYPGTLAGEGRGTKPYEPGGLFITGKVGFSYILEQNITRTAEGRWGRLGTGGSPAGTTSVSRERPRTSHAGMLPLRSGGCPEAARETTGAKGRGNARGNASGYGQGHGPRIQRGFG